YFLLVSSIESLSGQFFTGRCFPFEDIEKFKDCGRILTEMAKTTEADLIKTLKDAMLKSEYFVWQKFRDFIELFLPDWFWSPDELHADGYMMPNIEKIHLRRFLREAYNARSAFAHTGVPFPAHVEAGIADRIPTRTAFEVAGLDEVTRFVPVFVWFER